MKPLITPRSLGVLLFLFGLTACGNRTSDEPSAAAHESAPAGLERGPHNGRLLRDGSFAVEVTVYETGVPPQFRLYAYQNDKPLPPQAVQASVEVTGTTPRTKVAR